MTDELPEGWATTAVSSVADVLGGKRLPKGRDYSSLPTRHPYIRVTDFDAMTVRCDDLRYLFDSTFDEISRYTISSEDVYISIAGSIGKVGLIPQEISGANLTENAAKLTKLRAVTKEYLSYFLNSAQAQDQITDLVKATGQPKLALFRIEQVSIPLPPLPEQCRIVAKLEKLLAKVDASQKRLAKIPVLLKRFRQSVLSAACSGRLTEDWREENAVTRNHGDPLTHLRSHHRIAWERRQIERLTRLGKYPQNDRWKADYVEPVCPEVEEDLDLPDGWTFSGLELLLSTSRRGMKTGPFGTSLNKSEHQATGVPVLGIENIGAMRFQHGSKIHISAEKAEELAEFDAKPEDILISRSGTVGEVCVVPTGIGEARISTNVMRVCLAMGGVLPQLFCYLFNGSPFVLHQVQRLCGGSTRDFLNQTILQSLRFPVPPLPEQQEIVRRVEALFALADRIEARAAKAKAHLDRLTPSLLAKAFRGDLVPTEADLARAEGRPYEPASALLDRIKSERVGAATIRETSKQSRKRPRPRPDAEKID